MLAPEDLPGGGWDLISEDDFGEEGEDEGESPFNLDTVACREFDARLAEIADRAPGLFGDETGFDPVGRARREFERTAVFFPSTVELEVEVFDDVDQLEEAISLISGVLGDDLFGRCMSDVFAAGFEEGLEGQDEEYSLEVSLEEGAPSAEVPGDGGVGKAFMVLIQVGTPGADAEISLAMRMEFYFWRHSNAAVSAFIAGDADDLLPEEIADMVAAQAGRLEAAK